MINKITHNHQNSQNMKNDAMTDSNEEELVKKYVLGIGLTDEREKVVLEYIVKNLPQQQKPYYIVTPNPEMIVLANKDKEFENILNGAKIALCDGMQLYRAARALGVPLKERIIGTNFVEKLCEKVIDQPITVGFLGGRPRIAEKAAKCLKVKFPELKVVFAQEEWSDDGFVLAAQRFPQIHSGLTQIRENHSLNPRKSIDLLFVAQGAPKQEAWMAEHVGKIPVKVMMGVGGALDQIVDPTLRPPKFVHQAGLGWLYRLVRQPWRIKRQAKLVEFVNLVLKEKGIGYRGKGKEII